MVKKSRPVDFPQARQMVLEEGFEPSRLLSDSGF